MASKLIKTWESLKAELGSQAQLVVVSKKQTLEKVRALYDAGQRDFGENHVQELLDKKDKLPGDIRWHFIGHLQTNKVKYLTPFVHMIHSLDSIKLMKEVDKRAAQAGRVIPGLLQIHISRDQSKFGFEFANLVAALQSGEIQALKHISVQGLMGMSTLTPNENEIQSEFQELASHFKGIKEAWFEENKEFSILSMGMTSDYRIALACGSNLVRIGSLVFEA